MLDEGRYDTLIVVTPKDFLRLAGNYQKLVKCMPGDRIIFVGSEELGEHVRQAGLGERVAWMCEDEILPFARVHQCMMEKMEPLLLGRELPRGITGWYYQQFLKMAYAKICDREYYMVWDGDTIPCCEFTMFGSDGRPYLDIKNEYHKPYFVTMQRLLPDLQKCIQKSFIAEHMLMHCGLMRELTGEIEKNRLLQGTSFWEKVIWSIDLADIQSNSFSEFETFGTFVALRHTEAYGLRHWHSLRYGGAFFHPEAISERDYKWLSHDFVAISFEKGDSVREDNDNLFNNPKYQEKLTARQMLEIAQEEFEEGCYIEKWD